MILRYMTEADLYEVLQIENENFKDPWPYESFLYDIENNTISQLLVADSNGKITGYVGIWVLEDEIHITNIAVPKQYKRQGVAQFMFDSVRTIAERNDIFSITLEVRDGNEAAIKFYEKNGFKIAGKRKNYYKTEQADAIIYTLKIKEVV